MRKSIALSFLLICFFNFIDKALGFFFKIFLSRSLGAENVGVYQLATSLFFVLLTLISSGIPLVVSKRVAAAPKASDNKKESGKIVSAALIVGLVTAALPCLLVPALKPLIENEVGVKAYNLLLLLLPALLFSAVYGALRGWLWGKEKFFFVSLVEIIEQVARIISCVIMIISGVDGLIAAASSLTIGCLVSALSTLWLFLKSGGRLSSPKGNILPFIKSEAPITLSRASRSLLSSLFSVVVPALLVIGGLSETDALSQFGSSQGMALPLLFTPLTIIGALAFVLVPRLSSSSGGSALGEKITGAISFSAFVACLFLPVFGALGRQIGLFVYDDQLSGEFMSYSAWIMIPISLEAITCSIMNSLDLEGRSLVSALLGYLCQGLFYLAMLRGFSLKVFSVGLGLSAIVTTALNLAAISKKVNLSKASFITPIKCVLLALPSSLLTRNLAQILPLSPFFVIAVSGTVGMLAFCLLSVCFNAIDVNGFFAKKSRKFS